MHFYLLDSDPTSRSDDGASPSTVRDPSRGRSGDFAFASSVPRIVIPATPKERKKAKAYSVYGSPDINYSR